MRVVPNKTQVVPNKTQDFSPIVKCIINAANERKVFKKNSDKIRGFANNCLKVISGKNNRKEVQEKVAALYLQLKVIAENTGSKKRKKTIESLMKPLDEGLQRAKRH